MDVDIVDFSLLLFLGTICLITLHKYYELKNNINVLLTYGIMAHLSSSYWMSFFNLYIVAMLLIKYSLFLKK